MYDVQMDKDFGFYIPSLYYIIHIENQQSTINALYESSTTRPGRGKYRWFILTLNFEPKQ